MKKTIFIAAIILAGITAGISCNWFSSGSGNSSFIGKWKIDSVQTSDSTSVGSLLMALALDDSVSHHLDFTKDSVTVITKEKAETSAYKVDAKKKQIVIGEEKDLLEYEFLNDSTLRLTGSDSTALFFLKK